MPADTSPPTPSRRKRLLQKLGLSVAAVILLLAASELVLRLAGYGHLEIYQPDPALYWKLKPNQNCYTKIGHKPVRINSEGTRGPEFQPEKPAGTIRILSLGDSRTYGWGLSEAETYSARCQQLLQERIGPSKKVEVINAGVNAWSYPQMLVYFRDIALRYHPDIVVLAEANLWTQFSERNSPQFYKKFKYDVRLKNFFRHFALYHFAVEVKLKAFYERHRTKFIPIDPKSDLLFKEQQQKDPDALFHSAIEGVCRLALTNGIQPVLLFMPILDDIRTTNSSAVLQVKRDISRQLSVPLLDTTALLQGEGSALYLEADPVHVNARGNELVAQKLVELLWTEKPFNSRQ